MPPRSAIRATPANEKPSVAGPFKTSADVPFNFFGKTVPVTPPPTDPPQMSKGDIERAIPKHCFERSIPKSMYHLFKNLAMVVALGYAATYIFSLPIWAQFILWPTYWFFQGVFGTGMWVLAHECGHQAFSPSTSLNNFVGWIIHSALLVPYYSWAISHGKHHKHTCSIEHDEVFVPSTRSMYKEAVSESPLAALGGILVMFFFGWPAYLIANVSGPAKYFGKSKSHFNPNSALFDDDYPRAKRRWQIVKSDIGVFITLACIAYAISVFGFWTVTAMYIVPYFCVNFWLVTITYLQHTDWYVPHHRESASKTPEEAWLRGAIATVDRSCGWFLDWCFHHISDTHVAHHLFHEIPFYHAQEATAALRKKLGPYYLRDDTPFFTALWNSWNACRFIEDDGDIVFYKDSRALNAGFADKKTM